MENWKDTDFESEEVTVTLTLMDDSELECRVLTILEVNGRDYAALLPLSGPAAEANEVYMYRYSVRDGEDPVLESIETDEEYDAVSDAFDEYMDSLEFEELLSDDEE